MARLRERADMQPSDDDDESGHSSEEGGAEGYEGEGGDDDWDDEDGYGAATEKPSGEQARVVSANSSPSVFCITEHKHQFWRERQVRCVCDTRLRDILVSPLSSVSTVLERDPTPKLVAAGCVLAAENSRVSNVPATANVQVSLFCHQSSHVRHTEVHTDR